MAALLSCSTFSGIESVVTDDVQVWIDDTVAVDVDQDDRAQDQLLSGAEQIRAAAFHVVGSGQLREYRAYLLGPGIGGLAIGFVGAAGTFWISAGFFAVGALTMFVVRIPGSGRPLRHERPGRVLAATKEGVLFVWNDRVLRAVAMLSMVIIGFWLPVEGLVLPVFYQAMTTPKSLVSLSWRWRLAASSGP